MKTPNDSPKSSRKSRWNPAILALLQRATRDKAAEAASINTAALYLWQKDPEFQAALLEARREVFGQAMGRVQQASNPAVDTPIEIMNEGEYLLYPCKHSQNLAHPSLGNQHFSREILYK